MPDQLTSPAGDRIGGWALDDETPAFVISVAAQLAGMHAQTLRQYDRLGLVTPQRTRGGGRRYSARDVVLLREVQRLSQAGVSLAGIQRILDLEREVRTLRARASDLAAQLDRLATGRRVFAAAPHGEVSPLAVGQRPPRRRAPSQAIVLWAPKQ